MMAVRGLPRLIRLNRRLSWLLALLSAVVLLTGYGLTILDVEGAAAFWGHQVLGGVFGLVFVTHMFISVVVVRFGWRRVLGGVVRSGLGPLTLLRLVQRLSGWFVAFSAFLVLLSGLDWFKVGTGVLLSFSVHVRVDVLLSLGVVLHGAVGLGFALMRRAGGRDVGVSVARREAIAVLGGAFISLVAALYLDRIPKVAEVVDGVMRVLPPGQYEVGRLRALTYGLVPDFDEGSWDLKISGMVENPVTLSYREVRGLPGVLSVSDFHCVTGWTRFGNRWEGVAFRELMGLVGVLPGAAYVHVICEETYPEERKEDLLGRTSEEYTTGLPLGDVDRGDVLLAYMLDGVELPAANGGPLRLVVPHKYGYKSAKWVREIVFSDRRLRGFWEARGYSDSADPFTEDRYSADRLG